MITVVILTKNEEERIEACLKSVIWADEIIVIDSNSTDKTTEIAKKLGAKVYSREFDNYVAQKNYASEKVSGDWVLYVDADERVLQPLKEEIINLTSSGDCSAYAISRKNIIFGQEVNYKSFWPDWVVRLVRVKDFEKWVGDIHEHMEFKGKLGYTKNYFLHLTHRDVDQVVLKSLSWSKIDARLRLEANHPPMSGWRLLRILITELFFQGIRRGGFFAGTVGTIDALLQTFSLIITYIRLWQMQQLESMEDKYQTIDHKLINNNFKY